MAADHAARRDRFHNAGRDDQRQPFQRDRDRILYSSAFRRLAGVSQVVRAGEADVFHSRLVHSLKVAQIGRRLAELRHYKQGDLCDELGVDSEVVEAACLAHDLGHPPFGHPGEKVLNELVAEEDGDGGYEGNAQSFRIVTKLSVRFAEVEGLDLTRATLAAILKYPWVRDPNHAARSKKWGAYALEQAEFDFARAGLREGMKSAEAELMDWADDIAYSVHDLEDFHRCQVIPWHMLIDEQDVRDSLVENALADWRGAPAEAKERLTRALERLLELFAELVPKLVKRPYEATRDQRQQLRFITSKLIGRYINGISLRQPEGDDDPCVAIIPNLQDEVRVLKQITRDYVIQNPALAAQQRGQRRILKELFKDLKKDLKSGKPRYLPIKFKHLAEDGHTSPARSVADCIASLSEAEAVALHARLRGHSAGSVLDPIVR